VVLLLQYSTSKNKKETMAKNSRDRMEFEGDVIASSNDKFKVKVNDTFIVLCTLSGRIRKNSVKILTGDRVKIEVSTYDTSQGRITYRLK